MIIREVDSIDTGITYRWDVIWGDPIPTTTLGRWKLKAKIMRRRVRDAWLVLRGKADIE